MNKELKDAVDAEAQKHALKYAVHMRELTEEEQTCSDDFKTGAQFVYEHMTKPSGDDEAAAKLEAQKHWGSEELTEYVSCQKSYLAACAAKNTVIAARDSEIAELEKVNENLRALVNGQGVKTMELESKIAELKATKYIQTSSMETEIEFQRK